MLKIGAALICIVGSGLGFAEYYAHKFMKVYVSKSVKSYHITLDNIFVWPAASYGVYCNHYDKAQKQFDKCVKNGPQINYKIVCYPAIVTGFLFPRIVGICNDEEGQILKENKS